MEQKIDSFNWKNISCNTGKGGGDQRPQFLNVSSRVASKAATSGLPACDIFELRTTS